MTQLPAVLDPAFIDETLCRLGTQIIPLRYLEPFNGEEERRKFVASETYNPNFSYVPISDAEFEGAARELESLQPDRSVLGRLFEDTRDYLWRRLRLRRVIGTADFWDPSLYGDPTTQLLQIARGILTAPMPEVVAQEVTYGADFLATMFRRALRTYGLTEWQVVVKSGISATNVESINRLVIVSTDERYSMVRAKRLVVHEIETHVLRAANGYLQPYGIFGAAVIPGYLATEEGLALVNEERAGYLDPVRARILAARVIAASRAHVGSFREVFNELRLYGVPADEAWMTTKRVKRGLSDTSLPGGYVKDHVYLWGKLKLEQFIVNGGNVTDLYVGKIGLEHLDLVPQMGLLPPRYLPSQESRL